MAQILETRADCPFFIAEVDFGGLDVDFSRPRSNGKSPKLAGPCDNIPSLGPRAFPSTRLMGPQLRDDLFWAQWHLFGRPQSLCNQIWCALTSTFLPNLGIEH